MNVRAVHTEYRGVFAVELVVDCNGKAHTVMAIPAQQIRLRRVRDLVKGDDRWTGEDADRWEYHRPCGINGETACGTSIGLDHNSSFRDTRDYRLDQSLCRDGCWSPHEIALGMAAFGARTGRHVRLVKPDPEK